MLSTSATFRQSQRYPGFKSTQVPHTYAVTQPLPSHVYLSRYGQPKTAEFHVYTHGLDIAVVLCSQHPPHSGNHRDIPDSSPHRYPTHMLSHNHCHRMCICQDMDSPKTLNFTFIHTDSTFQCFYAVNIRHTPAITEILRTLKSTQVPHTYAVTQPLSSHVYLSRYGQSKTAEFHNYAHGLDISVLLCCQHPPHSGNHRDTPDSQVHTGTSHICCHTSTAFTCVCVEQ
jgi:hypothetical protein